MRKIWFLATLILLVLISSSSANVNLVGPSLINSSPISIDGTTIGLSVCPNTQGLFYNTSITDWQCQSKGVGGGGDTNTWNTSYDFADYFVNLSGDSMTGHLLPNTTLAIDLGSGPYRWRYLYVADISADDIAVSGDVTADEYYGSGAFLDDLNVSTTIYLNGTNISDVFVLITGDTMTGPLKVTDATYTVNITSTTISSNTFYAPLLQLGGGSAATASYSVAIGLDAKAYGTSSVAIGSGAYANQTEAMVFGGGLSFANYRAIALGYASSASGEDSSVLGYASTSSGEGSTAIGTQVIASGLRSLAMGSYSHANGNNSVSIGKSTISNGYLSFAFGDNVTVNGTGSYGFGSDGISLLNYTFTLHNLDLNVTGNITANYFIGDGSKLTGISAVDTWNTSTEMILAVNNSGLLINWSYVDTDTNESDRVSQLWGNISYWDWTYLNVQANQSIWETDTWNTSEEMLAAANASGYIINWSNIISSGTNESVFFNKTTTLMTANLSYGALTGYEAGNAICDYNFTGTHLCTEFEIIATYHLKNVSLIDSWTGTAYVMGGGAKYLGVGIKMVNDCNGFTDDTGDYYGNAWSFTNNKGLTGECFSEIPLACCKVW